MKSDVHQEINFPQLERTAGNGFVPLILNSARPELPPPGEGFVTLTVAEPELATSAALICACNWLLDEKVVVRALPLHCTVAPETKFCPLTISVKADAPALAELGLSAVMLGGGLGASAGEEPDMPGPPPHESVSKSDKAKPQKPDKVCRRLGGENHIIQDTCSGNVRCIKEQLTFQVKRLLTHSFWKLILAPGTTVPKRVPLTAPRPSKVWIGAAIHRIVRRKWGRAPGLPTGLKTRP